MLVAGICLLLGMLDHFDPPLERDFAEEVRVEPPSPQRAWVFLGMIGLSLPVIVVLLVIYLRKVRQATPPAVPSPEELRTWSAEDGFWIVAPDLPAGAVIRYRCRIDGQEREGQIEVMPRPPGAFVYLGSRPSDVRIVEIVQSEGLSPGPHTDTEDGELKTED
jgi:hypothetical protein